MNCFKRTKTSQKRNRFLRRTALIWMLFWQVLGTAMAQTWRDSLEQFHPIYESEKIRRIVRNEMSEYPEAFQQRLETYSGSLSEARQVADSVKIADIEATIGSVFLDNQRYREAIPHLLSALALYERKRHETGIAWTNLKLFTAYRYADLVHVTPLEDLVARARAVFDKTGERRGYAAALYAQGVLTTDEGERAAIFKKTLFLQDSLLRLDPENRDLQIDYARSLNVNNRIEEALVIARRAGSPLLTLLYLNNIGDDLRMKGEYEKAMACFEESRKLALENNFKTFLRNTYENIARVYWLQGKYNEAFRYRGLTMYLMEDLWSEQSAAEISRLRVVYETEKKELENTILQAELQAREQIIRQERLRLSLLLVVLVGLIGFLGLALYSRKRIKDAAKQIEEGKQVIEKQHGELLLKEEQLRRAHKTAKLAHWQWDEKTQQADFSEELPNVIGISEIALKAGFWSVIEQHVHPADAQTLRDFVVAMDASDREDAIQFRMNTLEGEVRWMELKVPKVSAAQRQKGVQSGTFQDISDLKRAEEARIELVKQQTFTAQLIESQEQERKRIAAELHDGIGQEMLIIKNNALLGLRATQGGDSGRFSGFLTEISGTATRLIENVRTIIYDLRPVHLEKLGLTETLKITAEQVLSASGIQINAELDNVNESIRKEDEIHVFRTVQEILNNVVKHSGASVVTFYARKRDNQVELEITDNGKGFDAKEAEINNGGKGFGLSNIQQRIRLIGGRVLVNSVRGSGTSYLIQLRVNDQL